MAFRERSRRLRAWGLGFLSVAGLLWVWCAVLLLMPYQVGEPDTVNHDECESRLLTDLGTANEGSWRAETCESERDWPEAVAVLALSVPVSIVGAILFTTGIVSVRLSEHAEDIARLKERDARTA
ncbi:hypothetical protein [Streptomyces scabichelini]|uniref:hypothetical protein n=1 Tax=Streptomyces scabichelini TaxID=2711217 RepID=UPI0030B9CF5A